MEGEDLGLPGPHGASQAGQLSDLDAVGPAVEALKGGVGRRRADRGVDGPASARARSVSTIRGPIAAVRSVQVRTPQAGSRQRHMRLRDTTGRPPVGRSRTRSVRRLWSSAQMPQPMQPTRVEVVWTLSCHSPATTCAARTSKPSRPAAWRPRHYGVDPPAASFLQTSRIRKLCEVPGAVLAAPTSPSTAPPTVHDEEPLNAVLAGRARPYRLKLCALIASSYALSSGARSPGFRATLQHPAYDHHEVHDYLLASLLRVRQLSLPIRLPPWHPYGLWRTS
jgi:hypothetical protein